MEIELVPDELAFIKVTDSAWKVSPPTSPFLSQQERSSLADLLIGSRFDVVYSNSPRLVDERRIQG